MDINFTTTDETRIVDVLENLFKLPFINPNIITHTKEPILHRACRKEWIKVVRLYIDNEKTDMNKYDDANDYRKHTTIGRQFLAKPSNCRIRH